MHQESVKPHPLTRRSACLFLAGASPLSAWPQWATTPASKPLLGAPTAAPANAFRTIPWDLLVAPGWDGMKQFRSADMQALDDGDPRAAQMLKKMREAWDKAPVNMALMNQAVRIAGYVVPLEEGKDGMTEFLLVPSYGACIHTPPPPSNQIVHVKPKAPAKGLKTMDVVWISGVLNYTRADTTMGVSSWGMHASAVEPYREGSGSSPYIVQPR